MSDRNPTDEIHKGALLKIAKAAARKFSQENGGVNVFVDGQLVHEVAARATVTLQEYYMSGRRLGDAEFPVELPNYFKQAGHVAYWVAKIKPLRLATFGYVSHALNHVGLPYDKEVLKAQLGTASTKGMIVLLNEFAALYTATNVIRSSELKLLRKFLENCSEEERSIKQSEFNERRQHSMSRTLGMTSKVVKSLRYDTHSPNSLALLFESLIGTGVPLGADEGELSDILTGVKATS